MISRASLVFPLLLTVAARAADLPALVLPEGAGVNIHFTRGHQRDLDLIAAAGFKFIRMDFSWSGTERAPGQYNWGDYDELTANLEQRGLRPLYILDYSNGLYEDQIVSHDPISGKERRDIASPRKPGSVAAFARWAGAAAAHFKGRRVIWEIWNEPNIGFWKPKPEVKDYIALVQATTKAVRQADPAATVVAPASSGFPWRFLEELLAAPGVLDQLDAVSVHPYRSQAPETADADYLRLRSLIERFAPLPKKSMPILSGEWGYSTQDKGLSLDKQAAYLARQQLHNLLHGVPISIWYDWKNDGLDPAYNEHNFGTVSNNLALKPSYLAMQTLARQLKGFRVARRLAVPAKDDFVLLLVNAAGDQKLAAWTIGQPHQLPLRLEVASSDLLMVNGQGQEVRPVVLDGTVGVALESAPQYITFKRPSRILAAEAAWHHVRPVPILLQGGLQAAHPLPISVTNPSSKPLRVKLSLNGPVAPHHTNLDLAPGQTLVYDVPLSWPLRSPETGEATLSLEFLERSGPDLERLLARSTEHLSFRLSNPLATTLTPTERGWRLFVRSPSGQPFAGSVLVERESYPFRLQNAIQETWLDLPRQPGAAAATVVLADSDKNPVTEAAKFAFDPLPAMGWNSHLDGDSRISARVSLVETNLSSDREAPFARGWRLDYQFEAGWRFVRCALASAHPVSVPPGAKAIGLWVMGDGSGNLLRLRVTDAQGQTFQPDGPALDWSGWRWVSFDLADLRQAGHWGGPNDGVVRGRLRLDCPLLLDGASRKTSGTICLAGPAWIL
jgi:polysaccharide biosynthesis protein PslG